MNKPPEKGALTATLDGDVGRVSLKPIREIGAAGADVHVDLADTLDYFALARPKVVVITGAGEDFLVAPPDRPNHADAVRGQFNDREAAWGLLQGILRCHRQLAEMDPIVIASVNGNAVGFGANVVLAADFIVAADDALIVDHHAALDEFPGVNRPFSLVPGDGGAALAPLLLPPALASEYLYLGVPLETTRLASAGVISRAVPRAQVAQATEELVGRLLRRSRWTLAFTKRIINRARAQQLALTLDASVAYEWITAAFAGDDSQDAR